MEFILQKIKSLITSFGLDKIDTELIIFSLTVTASIFLIELFYTGWKDSSLKAILSFEKSARTDVISWLLETFNLFNALAFVITFGVFYFLVGLVQKNFGLNLIVNIQNPYLQIALLFLIGDFKNYIRHWVFHKNDALWQLHSFHHSATRFTVLTRHRGHFVETEISRFFDVIPFVIFGAPIYTFFLIRIMVEAHQMLIHSSLKADWGFIGKYLLVSPAAHRIHHSVKPIHFNKNLGSTFIFWDRLFGTYHPAEEVEEIGIPDNPYNQKGYLRDVWLSMQLFGKRIIKPSNKELSPLEKKTTN